MPKKTPRGFTLVEMLVATALVVLMMLLFAQVFQTAAGLVSNQKGMAEQDQNVRTVTILLRGDMKSRTFRDVVPFQAGQVTDGSVTFGPNFVAARRKGFFSISENDRDNKTDDVLHLTITTEPLTDQSNSGSPSLPFAGRTSLMYNGTAPADPHDYLRTHPDQPEFDDGQRAVNSTGSSKYAEVCWFLRDGKLYRRQLLIRDPYNRNGNTTEEPQDSAATPFINETYAGEEHVNTTTNFSGVFWRDFDYSAYADGNDDLKFHSLPDALENSSNAVAVLDLVGFPRSLGIPFLRFGSSVSRATAGPPVQIFGPREFLDPMDPSTFIGRFTIEETTHADFAYPGNRTLATDPFNPNSSGGPVLTLLNGKVDEYKHGYLLPAAHPTNPGEVDQYQRRGEDIVMTNVHSFDIQVWDDVLNDFADLGHDRERNIGGTDVEGWYHENKRLNIDFGNRYDTWHPFAEMPTSPPYSPFGMNRQDSRTAVDKTAATNGGLGAVEEIPLRAIRIHIRFFDVNSDQMRDLTFTFPLVD